MTAPQGHAPRVVLGICGGIAAYKAVEVCRRLVDAGVFVSPVMTESATRFVGPLTFSALASEPVRTELLEGPDPIPHTRLGQQADLILVAPATARLIAAYAVGLSNDLLTATLLATRAPVLLAPAMHTEMWEHPAVQENLATLRRRGVRDRSTRGGPARGWRRRRGTARRPRRHRRRGARTARSETRPRRPPRPRHRGRHARADRSRALRRQPLVGEDGSRDRGRGRAPGRERHARDDRERGHPRGRRRGPGRNRPADGRRGRDGGAERRRDRDGRGRRRLPAPRRRGIEAQEGRRRARARARTHARHPRGARCGQAGVARCSSASPPRPTRCAPTRSRS